MHPDRTPECHARRPSRAGMPGTATLRHHLCPCHALRWRVLPPSRNPQLWLTAAFRVILPELRAGIAPAGRHRPGMHTGTDRQAASAPAETAPVVARRKNAGGEGRNTMSLELVGRSYENGEPLRVTVEGRRITRVEPAWPAGDISDWPWIAPGLFDLQINGHGGTWFSKEGLSSDDVISTLEPHFQYGITRMCPTLVTNSFEALDSGFRAIREACEREDWVDRMVPGCHLEGPYISREDGPRGAHPLSQVRPADWDEFQRLQEASGNRIRLLTLAPEAENAIDFIRRAVESGVVISIGHTGATPEPVQEAVAAGARLSTHLGNGAHGQIRRHPNYIWEQLGTPQLMASLITDGFHLPPTVVRSMIGAKGVLNTVITCDASGLAGCPPGRYREGEMAVEILEDGRLVLAGQDQLLAGSGVETDTCIARAIEFAGISLSEAIDMACRNPARLLGFEQPRLRRGSLADVILFHWNGPGDSLKFVTTVAQGDLRYGEIPALPVLQPA